MTIDGPGRRTFSERMVARYARRAGVDEEQAIARFHAAKAADDAQRQAEKAMINAARPVARFNSLGVQIMDNGDIHTSTGFGKGRRLGPAAGAHAEMAAERKAHRIAGSVSASVVLGPVGMLGAIGKKSKASSFVVLADGTLHEASHDGNLLVAEAQRQVVKFNAVAARYSS
jgi:hypothetical protein